MEIEKEIFNRKDYEDHFFEKIKSGDKNLNKTLEQALEVRKFEIELYWKRTTYFWAFIASSFAGYFVAMKSSEFKEMTIIVAIIGLLFSIGWYLANRGSKYWQRNWEAHVDLLENNQIGPLFKTILNPKPIKFKNITGEYPLSVSKINQILSFSIILIWIYILFYSIDYVFEIVQNDLVEKIINALSFLIMFFLTLFLFFKHAETGLSKEIKKDSKKKEENAILLSRKE